MAIDERWKSLGPLVDYVNLENVEYRDYQYNIIKSIMNNGNTLVVIPTGLGKTFIAVGVMAKILSDGKKALFLAPTKPLAEQHHKNLVNMLKIDEKDILLLVGSTSKKERKEMENVAKVIVATPQTIANDSKNGLFSLDDFGGVIFDECHHAVGRYAYTYIANECNVRGILSIGLTASPGSKKERIKKLIDTLGTRNIEARISTDPDVVKYVMQKDVHVINVEQTERVKQIAGILKPVVQDSLDSLNKMGFLHFRTFESVPKGRIIALGREIDKIQAQNYKFAALFAYVKFLNLVHAYDLLVIEGLYPFSKYLESLTNREKKSRSIEAILKNGNVVLAKNLADDAVKKGEEHAKVFAVLDVLKDYRDKSAIVFVQYRSTIKMLVEFLNNNGLSAMPFVGKKEGVTQAQQQQAIEDFRNRKFNVLVASSIGEEGLDIPSVDVVIFYEAIPNEIRNIQRRGRTGRFRAGNIYILIAKDTKDQIYLYISRNRELKMMEMVKNINHTLKMDRTVEGQSRLGK